MLEFLDIFGISINFTFNYKQKIKSNFGGFISILLAIIMIYLVTNFGKNFFLRKNPNLYKESINMLNYPYYNVSSKQLNLAFGIESTEGYNIKEDLFYFRLRYHENILGDNAIVFNYTDLPVKKCTKNDFSNSNLFKEYKLLKYHYCPDFNNVVLGGYWDSNTPIKYLEISILKCKEGLKNDLGIECGKDIESEQFLKQDIYVNFYTSQELINPNNYDSAFVTKLKANYFSLNKNLFKTHIFYYYQIEVNTDYGWLFENKSIERKISFEKETIDISEKSNNDKVNYNYDTYSSVLIYFTKSKDIYTREYYKIQLLIAEISGILKVFYYFGNLLVVIYNKACMEFVTYSNNYKFISNISSNFIESVKSLEPSPKDKKISKISNDINKTHEAKFDKNLNLSKFIKFKVNNKTGSQFIQKINEPICEQISNSKLQIELSSIENRKTEQENYKNYEEFKCHLNEKLNHIELKSHKPQAYNIELSFIDFLIFNFEHIFFCKDKLKKISYLIFKTEVLSKFDLDNYVKGRIYQERLTDLILCDKKQELFFL